MRLVKESLDEKSTFETLDDKDSVETRRKELKDEGYYIRSSKVSKGFTAKKEDKRIVVRIK